MFLVTSAVGCILLQLAQSAVPPELLKTLPPTLRNEVDLPVPDIIAKYNYSAEVHQVTTQDGYILTLHRILPKRRNKGAVLVMHGILASSADWIITGPNNGLGYLLANEGYDVWLGNARGNRYSKNHTTLNPNAKSFWNFSWHEIGYYDIPAMIDHILEITGEREIFHVAHSQGTTTFYVMCTLRSEYNHKIRAHFSLAPVAFVNHMFSPIFQTLAKGEVLLEELSELIDLSEILPKGGFVSMLGEAVCGVNSLTKFLCSNTLFAICGFNPKQLNTTILPLILAHIPAGCSSKQLLHYVQEINSGRFRQYDYGFLSNWKRYKLWKPSDYDLSQITAPIYFFYSGNDWISSSRDVHNFGKKLTSLRGKFRVSDDHFDHMDYLFGIDAPKLVYSKILSLMTRH